MKTIKISNEKLTTGNFLFYLALAIFIIRYLIRNSLLLEMLPASFSRICSIGVLVLLVIKVFAEDRYSSKLLIFVVAIFLLIMIVVLRDSYSGLAMTFALIVSAYNVKFEGILKSMAISICIGSLIVIFSCAFGLIPDYAYSHNVVSVLDVGHSLGFSYYSTLGYIVMTLSAIFLYFHRKCGYIGLLLLAIINVLLFAVHTTTLAILVGLVMIVAFIFTMRNHWLSFRRRIWKVIAVILPPACFLINLGLVFLFGNDKITMNASSLSTLRGRFAYSVQAIDEYGIHWFGSKVEMFGRTASTYGDAETAFYIDSAYMYTLIAYGILVTVVIILLYMVLSQYIYKLHDPYLFAWFAVMVVICMINNFILSYVCNPFLFMIPSALLELNKRRSINFAPREQNNVSTQR